MRWWFGMNEKQRHEQGAPADYRDWLGLGGLRLSAGTVALTMIGGSIMVASRAVTRGSMWPQ